MEQNPYCLAKPKSIILCVTLSVKHASENRSIEIDHCQKHVNFHFAQPLLRQYMPVPVLFHASIPSFATCFSHGFEIRTRQGICCLIDNTVSVSIN